MADKLYKYADSESNPPSDVAQYWFHCPGCGHDHAFTVGPQREGWGTARWSWNGSFDRPTFQPSLLCNKYHAESRCHSFVTDGKIQFLSDCHHSLAGKTVELPDYEGPQV
jgi:hypothetical protein